MDINTVTAVADRQHVKFDDVVSFCNQLDVCAYVYVLLYKLTLVRQSGAQKVLIACGQLVDSESAIQTHIQVFIYVHTYMYAQLICMHPVEPRAVNKCCSIYHFTANRKMVLFLCTSILTNIYICTQTRIYHRAMA